MINKGARLADKQQAANQWARLADKQVVRVGDNKGQGG